MLKNIWRGIIIIGIFCLIFFSKWNDYKNNVEFYKKEANISIKKIVESRGTKVYYNSEDFFYLETYNGDKLEVGDSISKKNEKIEIVEIAEDQIEGQMIKAYKEGMVAFENQLYLEAAKKFNEAEILFPQSEWAPRSALMAAYAYYYDDYNKISSKIDRLLVNINNEVEIVHNGENKCISEYISKRSHKDVLLPTEYLLSDGEQDSLIKNAKELMWYGTHLIVFNNFNYDIGNKIIRIAEKKNIILRKIEI